MALLLGGCGHGFTPTEVKKGTVWEVKKMMSPSNNLTELPVTKRVYGKEIMVKKAFLCFHSNGKVYRKIIGKGKWFFGDKTEVIKGGKRYTINKDDKKITIGTIERDTFSYTLRYGELTLQQGPTIIGVYKLSSEPEFTN